MKTITTPKVRWMIRRDIADALAFRPDLSESDLCALLVKRDHIGMVADDGADHVKGFAVYQLRKRGFILHHLEGTAGGLIALVDRLERKVIESRRRWVDHFCHEEDVPLQLFLRSRGWIAHCLLRGWFNRRDAILFRFRVR
jgi:hypothetical protein